MSQEPSPLSGEPLIGNPEFRMALAHRQRDIAFLNDVFKELTTAWEEHGHMNSLHEAHSVIQEEVDEFWLEVKKKRAARDGRLIYRELVQVAAMALKTAMDCKEVFATPDDFEFDVKAAVEEMRR